MVQILFYFNMLTTMEMEGFLFYTLILMQGFQILQNLTSYFLDSAFVKWIYILVHPE